jgi:hypothetical protein
MLLISSLVAVLLCSTCYANGPTEEQINQITKAANDYGVDPSLALAVAEVESGFNPEAVGTQGELGVFQLHPKFHRRFSIDAGVEYIKQVRQYCRVSYGRAWIVCYNRGPFADPPEDPANNSYYKRVAAAQKRWRQREKRTLVQN